MNRLRIAVVAAGDPADPRVWSGTPRGIFDGVRALGHEAVAVDALPARGRSARTRARIAAKRWLGGGPRLRPRTAMAAAYFGEEWGQALAATARDRMRDERFDAILQPSDGWITPDGDVAMFIDMTSHQDIAVREFGTGGIADPRIDASRERGATDAYAQAAAVCAATPWAARSVIEDYGIDSAKVHAVGIGGGGLPMGEALDRDWAAPRFLFVGTQWVRKNGPTVLEAFRRVRERHREAELHLVGDHPDLTEAGVIPHGFLRKNDAQAQQRLRDLYADATCLVVPGRFEAAGIVYLEAAAAGIPSICATVGGAPDFVGQYGRSVAPGDPDALSTAMLELCDPELARTLGTAAKRRAPEFTWERVVQRMLVALGHGDGKTEPHWTSARGVDER